MSNNDKKVIAALRKLAQSKAGRALFRFLANRPRDIRATMCKDGTCEYSMEVQRTRHDIETGIKDGKKTIVAGVKTDAKEYLELFEALSKLGIVDVKERGGENQPVVVTWNYSTKSTGSVAMGDGDTLLTIEERNAKSAKLREAYLAERAKKAGQAPLTAKVVESLAAKAKPGKAPKAPEAPAEPATSNEGISYTMPNGIRVVIPSTMIGTLVSSAFGGKSE